MTDRFKGEWKEFVEREVTDRLQSLKVEGTRLLVCVLGPGKGQEGHRKRCEMRDAINEIGDSVQALFPEDEEYIRLVREKVSVPEDVVSLEKVQVAVSDLIIALDMAPGVGQEVAIFAQDPQIAYKIVDLMPEKYENSKRSFPGRIREERRLRKKYYSDKEFKSCFLATEVCPTIVRKEQTHKFTSYNFNVF